MTMRHYFILIVSLAILFFGAALFLQRNRNRDLSTPTPSSTVATSTPVEVVSLSLLYPNGGEKLCLGEMTELKWQSSGITGPVSLYLHVRGEPSDKTTFVGSFLTERSEKTPEGNVSIALWKVGEVGIGTNSVSTVPENKAYEFVLAGEHGSDTFGDVSNGTFSIAKCGKAE